MERNKIMFMVFIFSLYVFVYFYIINISQDQTSSYYRKLDNNYLVFRNENTKNDTTDSILEKKECQIKDFSYSEKEIKKLWKFKTYKKCQSSSDALITIEDNTIYVNCQDNKVPKLIVDDGGKQYFGGKSELLKWKDASKANIEKAEYVFVKCDPGPKKAFVFNRFNKKISENSQKIRHNKNSNNTRPLTVLLLTLDSVSRNSAYRNLPRSIDFLNKNIKKKFADKYSVYDFKQSNIHGSTTPTNMSPILLGESYKKIEAYFKGAGSKGSNQKYNEMQKKSMWKYFSSMGFVTFFSNDCVRDFFNKATGRIIESDHVLLDFWRLARREFNYDEFHEGQRCFGDENAHYYTLNYTYQFLSNYKDHNRFAYAHISAAHEDTGNIRTVDDDLVEFFNIVFGLFNNENEDFVLLFIGDHSRENDKLQFSLKGFVDQRTALNFIILNKDLEKRMDIKNYLNYNSDKLLGRFDINLSLKYLANVPYGGLSEKDYQSLKKNYEAENVINIFQEKINLNRTCSHIGVSESLCMCNDFRSVSDEYEILVLKNLIELSNTHINAKSNIFKCKKIVSYNILKFETLKMKEKDEGWDRIYLLDYKTGDNNIVKVIAHFSTRAKIRRMKNTLDEYNHPLRYFKIGRVVVYLQISSINIINNCGIDNCIC